MKRLLIPAAAVLFSLPATCQAKVSADLLLPTSRIAPAVYTGTPCDMLRSVDAADYSLLSPLHQQMLLRLSAQRRMQAEQPHACWFGAAQPAAMALWNAVMQGSGDFNPGNRWSNTATNGGGLNQGDPTVITYSFVPDGTTVPGAVGAPTGPSQLFSVFNAAFPNPTVWQQRFQDSFDIWGQLTGVTYVFEPNDDGADLVSSDGQVGVRGDVRIAAKPIDGGSGSNVLAYNYFPNTGDMVLDTDNISFYSNASSNYIRLYNVVTHEHGHGLGINHVCPVNQTKLMEPFISTAFVGPQYDDILTAQRLYGDAREPNDSASTATDLGVLNNGTDTTTLVSIDGGGDTDWFRFTTTAPKTVDVILRPSGSTYLEGDQQQNGQCEPGVNFDPTLLRDLGFELVDSNGTSTLVTVDQTGAGGTESGAAVVPAAGDYYLRVFGGSTDQVQIYDFDLVISDGPPFAITIVGGAPAAIPADAPFGVDVRVVPGSSNADPNSGQLFASVNSGPYVQSSLLPAGGNDYRGLLPPVSCLDTVDWYVTFDPVSGGPAVAAPPAAPASAFRSEALEVLFTDNFEANQGWTVVNGPGLVDGAWERGAPFGGGDRGDPASDADGSGQCYLTDNVDGNSDVDGGATRLLSPVFDLSSLVEARMRWSYWFTNDFGGNPNTDLWEIDISDDGGANWTNVVTTTVSTTSWTPQEIDVAAFVSLTSQVQVRFTASDPAPGAVVEAGVDAFRLIGCEASPVTRIAASCAGAFALSTIDVDSTPTAGSSFSVQCSAVSNVTGPVFTGVVFGVSNSAFPLPSCGCTLVPSLDVIRLGVDNWTTPSLQTWSIPLTLPLVATGAELYAQGLVVDPASGSCTEAGVGFNTTDAVRITVQ